MYTWSTASGATPALLRASLITIAPSSAAGIVLSEPPMVPIAVRQAPANTTFFAIFCSSIVVCFGIVIFLSYYIEYSLPHVGGVCKGLWKKFEGRRPAYGKQSIREGYDKTPQ
jgi:hypothetical protein